MRRIRLTLLVAAASLLLIVRFVRDGSDPQTAFVAPRTTDVAAVSAARTELELELVDATPSLARAEERAAVDAIPIETERGVPPMPEWAFRTAPAPDPGTGQVFLDAIDTETGQSLTGLRVRALSATRIADQESPRGQVAAALHLTPDAYDLHVSVRGCEPAVIAGVRIVEDETTDVGAVRLAPGTARIDGWVPGDRADEGALAAELVGVGRRPCARCATGRCDACGFADESTRVAVAPDGTFAFERLAAAVYLVRLVGARERECSVPVRVDLQRAELHQMRVELAPPRTLEVSLEDADGASLAQAWEERIRTADVSVPRHRLRTIGEEQLEWRCTLLDADARVAANGRFLPPVPHGARYVRASVRGRCGGVGTRTDRDDRARAEPYELRPPRVEPAFPLVTVRATVGDAGLLRIDKVPARVTLVELRHGAFVASFATPRGDGAVRVRVAIDENVREPVPARTFRELEAATVR